MKTSTLLILAGVGVGAYLLYRYSKPYLQAARNVGNLAGNANSALGSIAGFAHDAAGITHDFSTISSSFANEFGGDSGDN